MAADIVLDAATGQQVVQVTTTTPASANSVTAAASALLGSLVTLNASLRAITLTPRAGKTIYWAIGGAASASTPAVPSGGISLTITKAVADTLYVYSTAVGPNLDIIQHV